LVLIVLSVALSLVFWPGHMDADALNQIGEARGGYFVDWWSAILDWMWRPLFLLHLSPGFVLLGSTTVVVLSVFQLLRCAMRPVTALVFTVAVVLFPPVLGYLGALSRDTWFGAAVLAAYALIVRAHRHPRNRRWLALLSLIAVWFAIAARQNGFIAVLPATFLAVSILFERPRPPMHSVHRRVSHDGVLRSSKWVSAGVSVVALLSFAGSQWIIEYHLIGAKETYPQQELFLGDLANLSLRTGHVLLPKFVFPAQDLKTLRRYDSPYTVLPLVEGQNPPLVQNPRASPPSLVSGSEESTLAHDWFNSVLRYPEAYFQIRWKLWTNLIAWSNPAFDPNHPVIDGNLWNYHATFPALNRAADDYLAFFTPAPLEGGVLYRTWIYLLLTTLVGADLLRRSRAVSLRVVGAMCIGALLYYLAYFFLAMGSGFRWGWIVVVATVVGVLVDSADRLPRLRSFVTARAHSLGTKPMP
jgi:hypothetical protein